MWRSHPLAVAMPMDKSRITGFGSDGSSSKTWTCPAGHMLQPWKAIAGACDGCKAKVYRCDNVMDCRQCNWYLCEACHPQEKEHQDWFWGSISYLAEAVSEEMSELKDAVSHEVTDFTSDLREMTDEFETYVADLSPFAACAAPKVDKDDVDLSGVHSRKRRGCGKDSDKDAEESMIASGHEGDDDGDLVLRRSAPSSSSTSKELKASNKSKSADKTAAQEEAAAGATETPQQEDATSKPTKPAAPPEDLMDFGQHDLLDLDLEPTPVMPVTAVAPASPAAAAAAPAPAIAAAPENTCDLGDLFSMPSSLPVLQQVAASPAGFVDASPTKSPIADDLLDLGSDLSTAATSSPVAPVAAPFALAALAPAETAALPTQQLLDFDDVLPTKTEHNQLLSMAPPPPPSSSLLTA